LYFSIFFTKYLFFAAYCFSTSLQEKVLGCGNTVLSIP
jgi:hypothetical protein